MRKNKVFPQTYFSVETIKRALEAHGENSVPAAERGERGTGLVLGTLRIRIADETWEHDSDEEFFADYRRDSSAVDISARCYGYSLSIATYGSSTHVSISGPSRAAIEGTFAVLEGATDSELLSDDATQNDDREEPVIFVGHGGDPQWRDLKDHLHEQHGFQVEAYEIGARAGHAVRDILGEMLSRSSFALMVMTAEDSTAEGTERARQNVVHEVGLFQGRLGFDRAIVLVEEGVEVFSNLQGVQQIRFSRGAIRETFGDVLATLRREFDR